MGEPQDYLAAARVKKGDKVDHGIKGMKWGVRRSKAQLESAAKSSSTTEASTKPPANETAQGRYKRLGAVAKSGKAHNLSDEDLKWYNARTEALARINKLNAKNPSWLKKTTDEVIKNVAKNTLQQVAQNAANAKIVAPLDPSKKTK